MALPKPYRLKRREEFKAVFRSGSRYVTQHLVLRSLRIGDQAMTPQISAHESAHEYDSQVLSEALSDSQPSEPPSRFGVSISQKVSKRAVVRNRIKRQLHAAIQHLRPRLSPGWLVVIVVRSAALECVYEDFLQELEQLLIESEVINGH